MKDIGQVIAYNGPTSITKEDFKLTEQFVGQAGIIDSANFKKVHEVLENPILNGRLCEDYYKGKERVS